ncbi:calcium uniporter protein, mitochondrial isoform X2 [Bradysia coprophila]|uniref:calcium uniporter protein, mitochondrial isoform X2 n=1 Tax=Bradysia coprophila TaxID=38358 RepID=UPI00187DCD32|nr:calcium uniporter protein, mitochondrial isoform X2 [Bradysia coprophila]
MAGVCCVRKCQAILKIDFRNFGLKTFVAAQQNCNETWSRRERRYCSTSTATTTTNHKSDGVVNSNSDVTVKYIRGLPHVTVPLPSRNEKCQFALRPVSHNVGDFLHMLRAEDKGIDRAAVLNNDGIRIAAACSIENLMDEDFWLHVNDKRYHVHPPERTKLNLEELSAVGDVKALVAQLYEALHVGEHQIKKERELYTRLEKLNEQLGPYEQIKHEIADTSERRTSSLTWVGLGLMSVQFGILARLTWWEYSWDIMEPVTYFVTYGTAMAAYAYYCLTKQEYNLPDVKDRQYLITLHKKAKKKGFDIELYNQLKREVAEVEHDLRRLRDPLYVRYSPTSAPNLTDNSSILSKQHGFSNTTKQPNTLKSLDRN